MEVLQEDSQEDWLLDSLEKYHAQGLGAWFGWGSENQLMIIGVIFNSCVSSFPHSRYEGIYMFELQYPTACLEWNDYGSGT